MGKYVATPKEYGEIFYCGKGDTQDEALNDFKLSGDLDEYAKHYAIPKGNEIEVYIYTCVDPSDSDYSEEELNPDWKFVLDRKVETRTCVI